MYDSKKEAEYAYRLDLLKQVGEVVKWYRQVRLPLDVNGQKVCTYIVDFVVHCNDGSIEHVDVKGYKTDVYKLKKKLVKAVLDIDIKEV
jgi:hypothetical protein